MAFSLTSDVEFLKNLPAYTPILKTVLKAQIQLLVNQLSDYGGEECVFLTASLSDGTLSHIGSKLGQGFLESHGEYKSKFLQFCLGRDSLPVDHMDLPTHASKKVSKKHQTCRKRKYSASSNNSCSKKLKGYWMNTQPALQLTDTENAENIPFKKTNNYLVDRTSGNCTDLSSKETYKIDKTANVLCPSLEACQLEKESVEKCIESMTEQNSSCLWTDGTGNYAVDNHDKYTKEEVNFNDDGTVADDVCDFVEAGTGDEINNVDESNYVDECDSGIKEEEDIIIKIEPIWDSESDTVDPKGRILTEGHSDDSLSNLEKEMSRPFTSSGYPPAHLQADFLCCNDDQIWEKNSLPKQKRSMKSVSLWTKYNAIKQVEQGGKKRSVIANELGVPKSTLSTWLKNADIIKGAINDSQISLHRKKRRFSNHYEIEEALLEWLKIVHLQAVVPKITAVNICDKANQLAKQFGYTPATFQCTKAWVERFKTRHGFKKNFVRADICSGDS